MPSTFERGLRLLVWLISALPLARLAYLMNQDQLGANPVEFIIRSLGTWTLVFVCLTLSASPLRQITGSACWIKVRRHLGLTGFFYAALHFTVWAWLEHQWAVQEMAADIIKRPYLSVGAIALAAMIPLAATSNQAMMRRLGAHWKRLHRIVYVIAILGVVHFYFHKQAKNDLFQVLVFGGIIFALLGFRAVNTLLHRFRQRPLSSHPH